MSKIGFRSERAKKLRWRILQALDHGNHIPQTISDYVNSQFSDDLVINKRDVNNYLLSMFNLDQLTRQDDPTYRSGKGRLMYFIKKKKDMLTERPRVITQ